MPPLFPLLDPIGEDDVEGIFPDSICKSLELCAYYSPKDTMMRSRLSSLAPPMLPE